MKYIAKNNFELKEIAGEYMLIPRGASTIDFNGVIVFNEAGIEIYKALSAPVTLEALAQILVDKYSIDTETATADAKEYIEKMLEADIIEVA